MLDSEDINGLKIVQELIKVARAGGGYVEYYYNDPSVTGDEDTGSPKVSYAKSFTTKTGREIVVGAGIYTGAATAVEGQSWGQLKSDF